MPVWHSDSEGPLFESTTVNGALGGLILQTWMKRSADFSETSSGIGSQLSRQRADNLFAVPGALLAEIVPANPVSDVPVKKYQLSIDGLGSAMARSVDEGSNISDEGAGRSPPQRSRLGRE